MKINNHEIKCIIFDLDGTLFDSCSIWEKVDEAFFAKRKMELPSDYAESIGHLGLERAAEYTINRFSLNEKKEDIIQEWKKDTVDLYKTSVQLKPHAYEFLKSLHDHAIPICAATANDRECYRAGLKSNKLEDIFELVLDVESLKTGKDKPDIYYKALEEINKKYHTNFLATECAVFEDIILAVRTANSAGFKTFAVYEETCKDEVAKEKEALVYILDYKDLMVEF